MTKSEKTFDGAKVLGNLTGLGEEKMKKIWEEIKANKKKLDECEGPHDFNLERPDDPPLRQQYVCSKCGGKVKGLDRLWYEEGLKHGRMEKS